MTFPTWQDPLNSSRILGHIVVHELELHEPYWTDMIEERKMFEVRRERLGRRFEVGDIITFVDGRVPGHSFKRRVTYVLRDMGWYGLPDDVAVLGLEV